MILLLAVLFGIIATWVRARICRRTLKRPNLRWEWLVFVAVIPQVFVFQISAISRLVPEAIIPAIQIASMLILLVFVGANLLTPGMALLGVGLVSNLLVIALNGGWMPVHPETLSRLEPTQPISAWEIGSRLGYTKDRILATADTQLFVLSDILTLPQWFPYKFAFSLGDIFISIGAFLLLWSLSRKEKENEE